MTGQTSLPKCIENKNDQKLQEHSWKDEVIIEAQYIEREKILYNNMIPKFIQHHGVAILTDKGNQYLFHNTPKSGVVVTNANKSKNWHKIEDINVNKNATIQNTLKHATGYTNNPLINYITSGTCIGTANRIRIYLEK